MPGNKRTSKSATKARRKVHWEMVILLWLSFFGMLAGLGVEVYLGVNNILWPIAIAFLGSVVGAFCDSALYIYRKHWRGRYPTKPPRADSLNRNSGR